MNIKEAIKLYDNNIRNVPMTYSFYNDKLFEKIPYKEWGISLVSRSMVIRDIFNTNKKAIDTLKDSVDHLALDKDFDYLYNFIMEISLNISLIDPPVYLYLVEKAIKHYEIENNYIKLNHLYPIYWQTFEEYYVKSDANKADIIINIAKKDITMSYKYLDKICDYANKTGQIEELKNIFIILINLISDYSNHMLKQVDSIKRGYKIFEYFELKLNTLVNLNIDEIKLYKKLFQKKLCSLYPQILINDKDKAEEYFNFIDEILQKNNDNYINKMYNLEKEYYYNPKKQEEILIKLKELFDLHLDELSIIETIELSNYYADSKEKVIHLAKVILVLCDKADIAFIKKKRIIDSVTSKLIKYISNISHKNYKLVGNFDNIIIDIYKYKSKYTSNFKEKEYLLKQLILRRQPMTYIHSLMVQEISLMITKSIISNNKAILEPLKNKKLTNDNYRKGFTNEILDYVSKAAFYHDLGKTSISHTINMQIRPLFDEEFGEIKLHPSKAVELLGEDKDFQIYLDVMQGHHKSYDGKYGYPFDFDNTKSDYKIIIDLVSIADSIDAATDVLGRNYASGKNFNAVLNELVEGSGTRYNPDIVRVIYEDKELKEKLFKYTTYGRFEVYHNVYNQIFNMKNEFVIEKELKKTR